MSEFKTYEYTTVTAARRDEALFCDCYQSFGWVPTEGRDVTVSHPDKIALKFKRDRKLQNLPQVNALQRKCEGALSTIDTLERKKKSTALTAAIAFGMIGTVFLAISVFNIAVFTPNIPLVIIFGLLGFIGWGFGYFSYVKVQKSQEQKVEPLIDEQYEIVYNTCEKAGALLAS